MMDCTNKNVNEQWYEGQGKEDKSVRERTAAGWSQYHRRGIITKTSSTIQLRGNSERWRG